MAKPMKCPKVPDSKQCPPTPAMPMRQHVKMAMKGKMK